MKVAVLAHIRFPIAEPYKGGMEAHAAGLCDELVRQGHDVTLFAAGGSRTAARLHPISEHGYECVLPWETHHGGRALDEYQRAAFERAWQAIRDGGFGIVHNNTLSPDVLAWAARDGVAMLTSLHIPPFGKLHAAVEAAGDARALGFTVTSASQLPLWRAETRADVAVVHNGIALDRWRPAADRPADAPLRWCGRITANKGTALALEAAHAAGVALEVAGPVDDAAYFSRDVAPLLDARRRHVGHLAGAELAAFVAGARALVVTPMWDEPFGLVGAEALACDVPVIAFDRGALGEVVGECGALIPAGDTAALARALAAPPAIPAGAARRRAETRFSLERMVRDYAALYDGLTAAAA